MNPQISVITPTTLRFDRQIYLQELYTDLCTTETSWEWLICVDGEPSRIVPRIITDDPRVTVLKTNHKVGAAAARNLALGLAKGTWVTSIDDDNRIPAGSLDLRFAATTNRSIGWVGGLLADMEGATLSVWDCPAPRGRLAAGDVWKSWGAPENPFPLGPTTLLVETNLLRSVGGWQGLPQGEGFGMVMAVTSKRPGVMLDTVVYHYRKHEDQMTKSPGFLDLEPLVRNITFERGKLLLVAPNL